MIGARTLLIALAAQIALAAPAVAQVEAPDAHTATPATAQAPRGITEDAPLVGGGAVDIITPHITDSHAIDLPCWNHATLVCEYELPRWKPIVIGGVAIDMSPTKHVVMLLVAAFLCCLVLITAARAHVRHTHAIGRPKGFAAGIEAMVLYIRQEVAIPNLGHHGEKYAPFILALFFFIMFANLLGLIPYGSTATGNISVTATLAIVTFIVVEIAGLRALGRGYFSTVFYWNKDLPLYMRIPLFIIMTPIEIIGKFTKPFALTIRLFANMTAGHIVVLELFVALRQAFIFSLLAAVFIGQIREAAH